VIRELACYSHTFAESYTNLHCHVLCGKVRIVEQSPRAAQVLETTSVYERSEVGARRLSRFLISLLDWITASIDTGKERQRGRGDGQGLEVQHVGKYNLCY
jgi:hypothetical protein